MGSTVRGTGSVVAVLKIFQYTIVCILHNILVGVFMQYFVYIFNVQDHSAIMEISQKFSPQNFYISYFLYMHVLDNKAPNVSMAIDITDISQKY